MKSEREGGGGSEFLSFLTGEGRKLVRRMQRSSKKKNRRGGVALHEAEEKRQSTRDYKK